MTKNMKRKVIKVVDAKKSLKARIGRTETGRPTITVRGQTLVLMGATGRGKNRALYFGALPYMKTKTKTKQ